MSDVLVDTSAWIEFFRNSNSKWAEAVDLLLSEERVCTTSLVIVEVVSGARTRSEFERLRKDFRALPRVDLPEDEWPKMLESRWMLKTRGVTGVSISDLMIAHIGVVHDKAILTCDSDFWRMRDVLGISLVEVEAKDETRRG